MKNTPRYIVLLGREEVIAYIVESEKFGLVVLFIQTKVDISKEIEIYNYPDMDKIDDIDLLSLILFPFPPIKNEE